MTTCYPARAKEFSITKDDRVLFKSTLSSMKGQRLNCIAMHTLTGETIYKVSIGTIEESINKLKAVLRCGTGGYSKDSHTFRAVAEYQKAKTAYDFALMQVAMKKHPTKAEEILMEMTEKFGAPEEHGESDEDSVEDLEEHINDENIEMPNADPAENKENNDDSLVLPDIIVSGEILV